MGHAAVFLDRDGVLNERRVLLVREPHQLELRPGVPDAVAILADAGYRTVVATNQGAVGWGWIDEDALAAIHRRLEDAVEAAGGRLDAVKACTCRGRRGCPCKKPRPGMLLEAAEELDLDLARSWMVGDKRSDMEAAEAAGARGILANPPALQRLRGAGELAEAVVPGLPEAVDAILEADGGGPGSSDV